MAAIFSWPVVTTFLLLVVILIFVALFSVDDERLPVRLIPKVGLDKLKAANFSQQNDSLADEATAKKCVNSACDYCPGLNLPRVNLDLSRYSWREVRASCSLEYEAVFANAQGKIRLI